MLITRRFLGIPLFAPALYAWQSIPNPNQNRLGFPQTPGERPRSEDSIKHDALSKRSHAEALKAAEELFTRAQQLRDDLRKAGDFVMPVSSIAETEKIEKLARKIKSLLKT